MDCDGTVRDGTGRVFLHLFVTDMLHYRQDKENAVFGLAARVGLILPSQNTSWPQNKLRQFFIFGVFNDLDFVSVHKNARKR